MIQILQKLTRPILLQFWWQDLLLLIPRLICGYLLSAEFGAAKFGLPWSPVENNLGLFEVAFWFPKDVASYGGIFALSPALFAWLGAFSEAIGGIGLVLGLQTRLFSVLVVSTMLVAIFMQQLPNGLWNCLPAMGFLWVGIFYLVMGSGRFGLDFLLTKNSKQS